MHEPYTVENHACGDSVDFRTLQSVETEKNDILLFSWICYCLFTMFDKVSSSNDAHVMHSV